MLPRQLPTQKMLLKAAGGLQCHIITCRVACASCKVAASACRAAFAASRAVRQFTSATRLQDSTHPSIRQAAAARSGPLTSRTPLTASAVLQLLRANSAVKPMGLLYPCYCRHSDASACLFGARQNQDSCRPHACAGRPFTSTTTPAHVELREVCVPARVGDHGLPALAWQRVHNGGKRGAVVAPAGVWHTASGGGVVFRSYLLSRKIKEDSNAWLQAFKLCSMACCHGC